jgi:hypothetical protein
LFLLCLRRQLPVRETTVPAAALGLLARLPRRATKSAEVCDARGSKRSVCSSSPARHGAPSASAVAGSSVARGSSRRNAATSSSFCARAKLHLAV